MPKCPHCFKSFVKNQGLNYHLNSAKNKCTEKNILITYGKKNFLCNLCSNNFSTIENISIHKFYDLNKKG